MARLPRNVTPKMAQVAVRCPPRSGDCRATSALLLREAPDNRHLLAASGENIYVSVDSSQKPRGSTGPTLQMRGAKPGGRVFRGPGPTGACTPPRRPTTNKALWADACPGPVPESLRALPAGGDVGGLTCSCSSASRVARSSSESELPDSEELSGLLRPLSVPLLTTGAAGAGSTGASAGSSGILANRISNTSCGRAGAT